MHPAQAKMEEEEGKERRSLKHSNSFGMASTVVVFDFDLTIIDADSDILVVQEFGATHLFNKLTAIMPWSSVMDIVMKELHSQGMIIERIADCLKLAPLDPHIKSIIQKAHALGCDLRVVSDANKFFIETILEHHGILECFVEINTNPSCVDDEGRLRILPYDRNLSHGCSFCPSNMCKGKIIKQIQESVLAEGKTQFVYLGDGKGDYCPSLKLTEGDYVLPRKNFPLWDLINNNIELVKADVRGWSTGEEMERILLQLIDVPVVVNDCDNSTSPSSNECKYEIVSKASNKSSSSTTIVYPSVPTLA